MIKIILRTYLQRKDECGIGVHVQEKELTEWLGFHFGLFDQHPDAKVLAATVTWPKVNRTLLLKGEVLATIFLGVAEEKKAGEI